VRRSAAAIALLLPGLAHATGVSSDVELVRPSFTAGAPVGMESPLVADGHVVRVGTVGQIEHEPIVMYRGGSLNGDVMRWRGIGQFGVNATLARHLALRVALPVALQTGGTDPDFLSDGLAAGDLEAGLRWQAFRRGPWAVGLRADVTAPLGTRDMWMGEPTVRPSLMLMGERDVGRLSLLANVRSTLRPVTDTGLDYVMGPSLELHGGAVLHVLPDHLAISASFLSRTGLNAFWQGGAETASEMLGGVQIQALRDVELDAGGGVGIAGGVGAANFRVLAGLTWQRHPRPAQPIVPASKAEVTVVPEEVVVPEPPPPPPPKPEWKQGELARVERREIAIRDPIQFQFGKDVILPVSKPTLDAVAELLRTNANIAYVVIEGHASDEGSYAYNYDLSDRRARAVFQALVLAGVHPDRLAYRGMGEVEPAQAGTDEAELAANRRVVFRIVRVYQQDETPPVYPSDIRLPWNGEPGKVTQPPPPPPPPPPAPTPPPPKPDDGADPGIFEDPEP
jgi:peptidoglycan-associated lipoprotein